MDTSLTPTQQQLKAIQEAAKWFATLQAQHSSETIQAEWKIWFSICPENRNAWAKVEAVQQQFSNVPAHLALPTLQKTSVSRRQILLGAAIGSAVLPFATWIYHDLERARWTAQYSTDVGEIAPLALADSSLAVLDTYSAADVNYSHDFRKITLHSGRIYIQTRPDNAAHQRPFILQTRHGDIQALGTEFIVKVTDSHTTVSVNQHAVRVTPRDTSTDAIMIRANERATFNKHHIIHPPSLDHSHTSTHPFGAWRNGSLIATNMPLGQFVERFQAYQRGYLFLDDSLSELQVSGVFPLTKPRLALSALENTYPVKIRYLTDYLTWIEPHV